MRRILLSIFLLFLFLLGAGTFYYLKLYSPSDTKKVSSVLPEQSYGYPIDQNGQIDKNAIYVEFLSSAKVREGTLTNLVTGKKIADIVLLEGTTKNAKGGSIKLNFIVQASLAENQDNVYSLTMEDNIKLKGLQIPTTSGNLSLPDLVNLFSKNSLWRIEADLKPLDPSDPLADPNSGYFKLMAKVDEEYFSKINALLASGFENTYEGPIIPRALYPLDIYQ